MEKKPMKLTDDDISLYIDRYNKSENLRHNATGRCNVAVDDAIRAFYKWLLEVPSVSKYADSVVDAIGFAEWLRRTGWMELSNDENVSSWKRITSIDVESHSIFEEHKSTPDLLTMYLNEKQK